MALMRAEGEPMRRGFLAALAAAVDDRRHRRVRSLRWRRSCFRPFVASAVRHRPPAWRSWRGSSARGADRGLLADLHVARALRRIAAAAAACGDGRGQRFVGALSFATFSASGADASGYLSQADMWARPARRVRDPLATLPAWPLPPAATAPLGWRPALDRGWQVPTYAPGLPWLMAIPHAWPGLPVRCGSSPSPASRCGPPARSPGNWAEAWQRCCRRACRDVTDVSLSRASADERRAGDGGVDGVLVARCGLAGRRPVPRRHGRHGSAKSRAAGVVPWVVMILGRERRERLGPASGSPRRW